MIELFYTYLKQNKTLVKKINYINWPNETFFPYW